MKVGINLINHCILGTSVHYFALLFCLRSLLESDLQKYDWELVLVENGSTCEYTNQFSYFLEVIPNIKVIHLEKNLGIPKGRNVAYRELMKDGCDYIVEVHSDHLFPSYWLTPLIEYLEAHPEVGACGPGNIITAPWTGLPHAGDLYAKTTKRIYEENLTVEKWSEVCALTYHEAKAKVEEQQGFKKNLIIEGLLHPLVKRVKMLEEIGLYEEGMPVNQCFEDMEEYYRADKAGWKFSVNWNSLVYHYGAFSRVLTAAMYEGLEDWTHRVRYNDDFCRAKHGDAAWSQWILDFEAKAKNIHNLEGSW